MFYKKISAQFAHWGKKNQQLSNRNEEIKINVLNSLRATAEPVKIQRPGIFRWIALAAVPALAVLLMVNYWRHPNVPLAMYAENSGFGGAMSSPQEAPVEGIAIDENSNKNADMMETDMTATGLGESASFKERATNVIAPAPDIQYYPDYYRQNSDITDTREFLKTSLGFEIKTRQVETMYTRLKTIIRGYDGRIDNSSAGEKYARISFVLPKKDYEAFVDEIQTMFPKKFITLNENNANLLGQKQNIEQQTQQTNLSLEELKNSKENLTKKHNEKISALQKEINQLSSTIYSLTEQKKAVSSTEETTIKKLNDQINYYTRVRTNKNQELSTENKEYQTKLDNYNKQITYQESRLTNLDKQDQNLINNVETVDGTIALQWVSIFDVINLYMPIYKIAITVCIIIIVGYLLFGRRSKEIELP